MSRIRILMIAAIIGVAMLMVPTMPASAKQVKVTICHVPPGNPANAHTITVAAPAVAAHLAHGDTLGACMSQ